MKKIRLTEAELNQMVSETIKQVLKEGFMDNMKAGFQGFKSGYKNSQLQSKCDKILDLGNELANELYRMDLKGISLAAGSACASASIKPSHVLTAMGLDERAAKECVRISFGKNNTVEEIEQAAQTLIETVEKLRS
jgi:cysteine sulfinate desulfinase/cysteine desulfurase-like protein